MSILFGRNVEADTKETVVVGKVELNMRPMRVHIYEIQDELGKLDNILFKHLKESELFEARDQLKVIRRLLNSL